MTTLFRGIEAQPNFPREDLTDANAGMFELMLANRGIVQTGHFESERVNQAFRRFHPAVVSGTKRVYDDGSRLEAVDHGVASFETMSMMLASALNPDEGFVVTNSAALIYGAGYRTLEIYVRDAFDAFCAEMPRTSEVIDTASRRFYGALTQYAQLGAAMMRQVELDSTH